MPDKPEVQRIHVPIRAETSPDEGGPAKSHYDFQAESEDTVRTRQDSDGTFRWQLVGANGKLKLEAGNFPSRSEAKKAARSAHGTTPTYQDEGE